MRKLNYNPLTSFEPICRLVSSPLIVVVNSTSPFRTLADLLNAARAKGGQVTLAGSGPATPTHIAVEMLNGAASVDITFVPYTGIAPAVSALLGDHVTSALLDYGTVADHLKAGKLRALATGSRTRIEPLPDVPTVTQSGYEGYEADLWFGLFAPAKTATQIVSQLAGQFAAAVRTPDVQRKLVALGLYPDVICGAAFGAFLRKEYDEYGRIIRDANIKAE